MSASPTSRSLAECKKRGWTAGIVERRVPFRNIAIDFLNCIDIIAFDTTTTIGIQATSGSNHAARVAKILAEPKARLWINATRHIEVWSWAKKGPRGARKRWTLRAERVTGERFECASDEMVKAGGV
jgi:hypothetical protein